MDSKYADIISRFEKIQQELSNPKLISDRNKFRDLSIEQSELSPLVEKIKQLQKLSADIAEAGELQKTETNQEYKQFYTATITESKEKLAALSDEIDSDMRKQDANDVRDAIVEIRAGTGGEEASLFAAELYRMYRHYAEGKGWQIELYNSAVSGSGGFKEIIFQLNGKGAFGKLKYENGVHRVQRIPATEAAGRIHTSAVSVVVLPVVEDVEVEIKDEDIRIDVFRSSGPGGQSVNTTDSAVRITHSPTGIVVTCQDEKSQLKNKQKAMSVLKSRIYDLEMQKKQEEERKTRNTAIGGGDRSAKIRTYNFPQSRITDHRIKVSWHNLASIMDGAIDEMLAEVSDRLSKQ